VRIIDTRLLQALQPESYLKELIFEYSSKVGTTKDREKSRKRQIQSIWGRDASDRKQRVISFLKNCGLSLSPTDEKTSASFSDELIDRLSDMTPTETASWLGTES
jgi:hypothetical protein